MKYMIAGAGGTGGTIGFFLSKAGRDCTVIARGEHLQVMRKKGLTLRRLWDGSEETVEVSAMSMDEYLAALRNPAAAGQGAPDVIFVCVKGYSLEGMIPFIRECAGPDTVVIPVLNIFGTGAAMQEELPGCYVTDGCIYVSADREAPGRIVQHGPILRILFGARKGQEERKILDDIAEDLNECGITGINSRNIERDALGKFSYVSPAGAAGLYYHGVARDFMHEGEKRDLFVEMIREIEKLAEAMGFPFQQDYVKLNLQIMDGLSEDANTSMQRDVDAGRPSEVDGLVYQVVRTGKKYGVSLPAYEKVAKELMRRGLK